MTADGAAYGGYGTPLKYGEYESRTGDHTVNNWHTQLPNGNIKFDNDINAQVVQVVAAAPAYKAAPAYAKPAY